MKYLIIAVTLLLVGCGQSTSVEKKEKRELSPFILVGKAPYSRVGMISYFSHKGNDCYVANDMKGVTIFCLKASE